MVKDIFDLTENWCVNFADEHVCAKSALLGQTVLFPVTFREIRSYLRTDRHTPDKRNA